MRSTLKDLMQNINQNLKPGGNIMSEGTVVKFTKEKETKNTINLGEVAVDGRAPIVGTLYVQKWWAGDADEVEITISK